MKIDNGSSGMDKLCIMIFILLSIFSVNGIEVNATDNVTTLNLSNFSFSSINTGFQIENNNSISNNTNEIEATTSDLQQAFGITPPQVLSPVVGLVKQDPNSANCPLDGVQPAIWCFWQRQSGGHLTPAIGGADDRYAWDANLNTPIHDSDNLKPVYAVAPGYVPQFYGGTGSNADGTPGSFGQVLIEHTSPGGNWWSGYLHLRNIQVKRGQKDITANTIIGYISDKSTEDITPHLHFVVYTGENSYSKLKSFDTVITPRLGMITPPIVANGVGAKLITANSAKLYGEITNTGGENPTVRIYYGTSDGGENPGSWEHYVEGVVPLGSFYVDLSGFASGTKYYYKCYASNSAGSNWASATIPN